MFIFPGYFFHVLWAFSVCRFKSSFINEKNCGLYIYISVLLHCCCFLKRLQIYEHYFPLPVLKILLLFLWTFLFILFLMSTSIFLVFACFLQWLIKYSFDFLRFGASFKLIFISVIFKFPIFLHSNKCSFILPPFLFLFQSGFCIPQSLFEYTELIMSIVLQYLLVYGCLGRIFQHLRYIESHFLILHNNSTWLY